MIATKLSATAIAISMLSFAQTSEAQFLGTAEAFGVLAGSTVTNTGPSVINGDLGVWPGTAVTGVPLGIVNGIIHAGDGVAMQAQADLTVAYTALADEAFDFDLTGQDLGGMTLLAGVYKFSSSASLTGLLRLDARGDQNARFVFQIGSTLITASNSVVNAINGKGFGNTYCQVGSSATLGTGTTFGGHILALTSITMNTGAAIVGGSALARKGAVSLDSNTVTTVPEPGSQLFLAACLVGLTGRRRRP